MSQDFDTRVPLVEVGRYERLADARDRGLVMAARDLPHWIEKDAGDWVVRVEEHSREAALRELLAFEKEQKERPVPEASPSPERIPTLSLYLAGWLMIAAFLVQNIFGPEWTNRGEAVSELIAEKGEWWRVVTALTLHGDAAHLMANLATGLLFAAFVISHIGAGMAWLGILLSGAAGNLINAWMPRVEAHASIGASTAVFGALGLLVGAESVVRLSEPGTRSRWQLVLPLGAGLALLAFLGIGEEHSNTDIFAHFWGFIAGLPIGALGTAVRIKARTSQTVQRAAAVAAFALLAGGWWLAWRP